MSETDVTTTTTLKVLSSKGKGKGKSSSKGKGKPKSKVAGGGGGNIQTTEENSNTDSDEIIISSGSSSGAEEEKEEGSGSSFENRKAKRSKLAKKAYEGKDAALSMEIHSKGVGDGIAKEKHKKGADYLKSIIYGGLDGIMTTFAVVAGAAGANLGSNVVLIMGFANLIADGISMGVGDFISGKAEIDYSRAEKRREEWEYDNYPKGEIDEMVEIYHEKGMSLEDAKELVAALNKHRTIFIETMMVEELGIMAPDPSESPAKHGFVTFISFCLNGIVPLIPFMIGAAFANANFWTLFIITCVLVGIVMFALGAITSRFTILSWYKGGFYMFIVGAIAAAASYLIGWGVGQIVGKICTT